MRVLVLGATLASGCSISTIDPHDAYLSVDLTSATVALQGDRIAVLSIEATATGPILGGPITSGGNIVTQDWTDLTDLQLTTGDQEFYADQTIFLVDTRHAAPAVLQAACGTTVKVQAFVGGEVLSYGNPRHVETVTNVIDTPVQCF